MVLRREHNWARKWLINGGLIAWMVALGGCASTSGSGGSSYGPPPIPEGKGRLMLEAGGINEVNYYVLEEESGEEVHAEMPRSSASSPIGYESGYRTLPQYVDLDPGRYLVVVNTDIDDSVEKEIEVRMGQEVYATIPVGRFQVIFSDSQGRSQVPFLIYDYNLRTMLGRGMTSTEVRYFIVPVGEYKVRIENSPTGLDEIRPVQVNMGQTQNILIGPPPSPAQPGEGTGDGTGQP